MDVTTGAPETEADVLRRGTELLIQRLPSGWGAALDTEATRFEDARITVMDPTGNTATLIVEAKRVVEGRDVGQLSQRLPLPEFASQRETGLVVARYLSKPVREKLTAAGLNYIDATGNIRVELQTPGLFISDRGEDKDPWRGKGRPRGTLKGEPAAKIVRTMADYARRWKIRELVDESGASTGSTYRVVEFLEREGMAQRGEDGRIEVLNWVEMLRRWSDDYGFESTNQTSRWLAPRGLPTLIDRIASSGTPSRYAVTGTLAAAEWAQYAPARLAMIYVADAQNAAGRWDLRPTEAGANVLLAEPKFPVVWERTRRNAAGVAVAAPTQVVVDLMTGPGRNPSEAEELLEWMVRNEDTWRR